MNKKYILTLAGILTLTSTIANAFSPLLAITNNNNHTVNVKITANKCVQVTSPTEIVAGGLGKIIIETETASGCQSKEADLYIDIIINQWDCKIHFQGDVLAAPPMITSFGFKKCQMDTTTVPGYTYSFTVE